MTDNFMVGYLGTQYLAALKIGSDYIRFFIIVIMSVTSAATVIASRHWGRGDTEGFKRSLGITLGMVSAITLCMALVLFFGGEKLSRLMIADPDVCRMSGTYLRIYSLAMLFSGINMAIAVGFIARGKTFQPLIEQIIATSANVVLNYLLIFGHAGFPRMEVQGAAWASVIAVGLGSVALFIMAARDGMFTGIHLLGHKSIQAFKDISSVGWPLLINMAVWQGSMLVYLKIIATYGATATAVWGVSSLFTGVLFIFVVGFRTNISVVTGQLLGASEYDEAYTYGSKAMRFVMLISLISIVPLLLLSGVIPSWFKFSSDSYWLMVICLILTGAKQMVNTASSMLSSVIISGKDSKIVMHITILALLLVGLPSTYLVGIILKLGIVAVFLAIMAEDVLKATLYYARFRSKKWMHAG